MCSYASSYTYLSPHKAEALYIAEQSLLYSITAAPVGPQGLGGLLDLCRGTLRITATAAGVSPKRLSP